VTPQELTEARADLGVLWGLGRPLHAAELGRILRLPGRDPGRNVMLWERRTHPIPGPVSLCVDMMLRGARPPLLEPER